VAESGGDIAAATNADDNITMPMEALSIKPPPDWKPTVCVDGHDITIHYDNNMFVVFGILYL
jgi:hypothetical protein